MSTNPFLQGYWGDDDTTTNALLAALWPLIFPQFGNAVSIPVMMTVQPQASAGLLGTGSAGTPAVTPYWLNQSQDWWSDLLAVDPYRPQTQSEFSQAPTARVTQDLPGSPLPEVSQFEFSEAPTVIGTQDLLGSPLGPGQPVQVAPQLVLDPEWANYLSILKGITITRNADQSIAVSLPPADADTLGAYQGQAENSDLPIQWLNPNVRTTVLVPDESLIYPPGIELTDQSNFVLLEAPGLLGPVGEGSFVVETSALAEMGGFALATGPAIALGALSSAVLYHASNSPWVPGGPAVGQVITGNLPDGYGIFDPDTSGLTPVQQQILSASGLALTPGTGMPVDTTGMPQLNVFYTPNLFNAPLSPTSAYATPISPMPNSYSAYVNPADQGNAMLQFDVPLSYTFSSQLDASDMTPLVFSEPDYTPSDYQLSELPLTNQGDPSSFYYEPSAQPQASSDTGNSPSQVQSNSSFDASNTTPPSSLGQTIQSINSQYGQGQVDESGNDLFDAMGALMGTPPNFEVEPEGIYGQPTIVNMSPSSSVAGILGNAVDMEYYYTALSQQRQQMAIQTGTIGV